VAQSSVADLVKAASVGDMPAWEGLVERFAGLVWGIARSHRLGDADAADVSQTVWLRLVEHLPELREPAAVGGWLATTTRHESLRVLRRSGRETPADDLPALTESPDTDPTPEELVVRTESNAALWQALETLSVRCRTLLRALATWPDANYAEVSAALDMPIGSIGPTRARCLVHLRRALVEQAAPNEVDGW
jgi:RNA polymerase sigma factor (sigma-70 family)